MIKNLRFQEYGLIDAREELICQKNAIDKLKSSLNQVTKELALYKREKGKRASELIIANKELAYENELKESRAIEKKKRAVELVIAKKELAYQNEEKEKRVAELKIANIELLFQTVEKEKRAAELVIADIELDFQNKEKIKKEIVSKELEALIYASKLSSQYSRSLIEASLDPLVTISINGKITDVNEATIKITGLHRNQLIDTNFSDYFTEPEKAKEGYKQVFKNGFVSDFPLTIKDINNTPTLFNGAVYKDGNGKVLGAVVVARIITEQKRFEKELTEARVFAEMATLLAEEAKIKAENAMRTAEDAVKAKQQFLSNMSHEIRTPMNAIIGFSKVLLKTDLSSIQKQYLAAIKTSGDALIVLINDILDLAKVDAGKMTFEKAPFKPQKSIATMLHLFATKIEEKNLKLVTDYDIKIPEFLVGDSVRLHQIILNLVSNAVKFTSEGKITVSVKLLKEDEKKATIHFSVSDTGIGIEEFKISKIFENFQQASSGTSRLYGGTGLGLAIVKQLVEAQGGSINVKSKLNKGSDFSFVLDFQKTNERPEEEVEIMKQDTKIKSVKILVVEDMALNQLLMKTLLDDFGFDRDIAGNGKIAIERMKTKKYDIILMDLQMPEMNGFECTEYIRNTLKSKIPIIALTADVTTSDLKKCKAVGMNDYLAKPINEKLLYTKIVGLVKKPLQLKINKPNVNHQATKMMKYCNLEYLISITKNNKALMNKMIVLYIKQTPALISDIKKCFQNHEFPSLLKAAHKIIPSFALMGISSEFENMAKNIQQYAISGYKIDGLDLQVLKLEQACLQACLE